ncbi:MAG: alpha/beta fold hydrolase [Acidobacteriia bacterium]|nr:alpha/beta fold hydrolase [Terriglobia bacterium]
MDAVEVVIREFADTAAEPAVRGFLHTPAAPNSHALVLTHGAGANCQSPLLRRLADAFAGDGFVVLRCDLPFRQKRPHGPPFPATAAQDRAGLQRAVSVLREKAAGQVFLGGHSYGGRQASMLSAENPGLVAGLLLLSYPLHPPRKPQQLRTEHLPQLKTPALFVHGERDPFGSVAEMQAALQLIPARSKLLVVERAGHDLLRASSARAASSSGDSAQDLPTRIRQAFRDFFAV